MLAGCRQLCIREVSLPPNLPSQESFRQTQTPRKRLRGTRVTSDLLHRPRSPGIEFQDGGVRRIERDSQEAPTGHSVAGSGGSADAVLFGYGAGRSEGFRHGEVFPSWESLPGRSAGILNFSWNLSTSFHEPLGLVPGTFQLLRGEPGFQFRQLELSFLLPQKYQTLRLYRLL